jgi:hypothetical protein
MVFISVTRLRIKSIFYFPQFIWQAFKTGRQAEQAGGFLGGRLVREAGNIFWTLTMWVDEGAMRAYRSAGAHAKVMPKLLNWCNEASVVHWSQEQATLPGWQAAHQRMVSQGRLSKVNHPSADQLANRIPPPKLRDDDGQLLTPVPASKQ